MKRSPVLWKILSKILLSKDRFSRNGLRHIYSLKRWDGPRSKFSLKRLAILSKLYGDRNSDMILTLAREQWHYCHPRWQCNQWQNLTVDFVESRQDSPYASFSPRFGSLRFVHGQFSLSQRQTRLPLRDHERKGAWRKPPKTCQRV